MKNPGFTFNLALRNREPWAHVNRSSEPLRLPSLQKESYRTSSGRGSPSQNLSIVQGFPKFNSMEIAPGNGTYVCNKVRSTACACLHSRIIATCGKLPRSHLNTSQHIFWDLPLSNHVKSHQIFSSQITPFGLQTCNSTTIAMAPIVTVAEIKICVHYRVPVTNLAQQGYLQAFAPFKLPCWKAVNAGATHQLKIHRPNVSLKGLCASAPNDLAA